jgi:glycosyltransferase involved in cell wall biosynthesis
LLRVNGRPLKVLLINQYFHPDLAATAQIMTDLAVDLVDYGAQVTTVTGRTPYVGSQRYRPRDEYRGVTILRPPTSAFGRQTLPGRITDFASFYGATTAQLALLPRHDVVTTLSTPPLISLLGAAQKVARGARFIYWVQDLYPDVAVKFGVLKEGSLATRTFEQLSRASLRAADAIVALGDAMAQRLVAKGAPPERTHVIHNWSDSDIGAIAREKNWFIDQHGLREKFVVLYSGNMGRGHEFDTLLGAARKLSHRSDTVFLFIGDGAKKREVETAAAELSNVRLLPYQKREDLPYSLGAGDLFAITQSDGLEGLIVPSKLYGALAASRPVLFIGPRQSDTAQVIESTGCGRVFGHGDVDGVAAFVAALADSRALRDEMGQRGRASFETTYDRKIATEKFARLCLSVVADRR